MINESDIQRKKNKNKFSKLKRKLLGKKTVVNYSSDSTPDAWDIDALIVESQKIKELSDKISGENAFMAAMFRNHQEAKLIAHINALWPSILHIEESIRVWLEAIVMKKWILRHDALRYLHQLDSSITQNENDVDCLQDYIKEYEQILAGMSCELQCLRNMKWFCEELVTQENNIHRSDSEGSTFRGYVSSSVTRVISPAAILWNTSLNALNASTSTQNNVINTSSQDTSSSSSANSIPFIITNFEDSNLTPSFGSPDLSGSDRGNIISPAGDATLHRNTSGLSKSQFIEDSLLAEILIRIFMVEQAHEKLLNGLERVKCVHDSELMRLKHISKTRLQLKHLCEFDNILTRGFSLANAKIGNDRDSKASASGVGDRDDTLDSLIFHSKQVFQSGLMSSIRGLGQLASGSSDDVSVLGSGDNSTMAASAENISNTSQTKGANKKSALERIVFCIEHLENLLNQEKSAQSSLVRVLELKGELEAICDKIPNFSLQLVDSRGSSNSVSTPATAGNMLSTQSDSDAKGAYLLVRGGNNVPSPFLSPPTNVSHLSLCRTSSVGKMVRAYHLVPSDIKVSSSAGNGGVKTVSSKKSTLTPSNSNASFASYHNNASTNNPTDFKLLQRLQMNESKDLTYVLTIFNTLQKSLLESNDFRRLASKEEKKEKINVETTNISNGTANQNSISSLSSASTNNNLYIKELKTTDMKKLIVFLQAATFRVDITVDKWNGKFPTTSNSDPSAHPHEVNFVLDLNVENATSSSTTPPLPSSHHHHHHVSHHPAKVTDAGIGLIWESKNIIDFFSSQRFIPVGVMGLLAVFAKTCQYTHILSAIGLRDEIWNKLGIFLPIVAYSSKYDTFIGLSHSTQLQVLRDFVVDCAPTECQCAAQHSPCATLHSSFGFPVNMNVFYEDLNHNHNTLVQILCSWPRGPNEDRLYVAAIEDNMKVVLLKGIMDAIASVNILGALRLVETCTVPWLDVPSLRNIGISNAIGMLNPFYKMENNLKQACVSPSSASTNCPLVAPFEDYVDYVMTLNSKCVNYAQTNNFLHNPVIPQMQLLVPLGAFRVLSGVANMQLHHRLEETKNALWRWLELSGSLLFRMFGKYFPLSTSPIGPTVDGVTSLTAYDKMNESEHIQGIKESSGKISPPPTILSSYRNNAKYSSMSRDKSKSGNLMSTSGKSQESSSLPPRGVTKAVLINIEEQKEYLNRLYQIRIPLLGSDTVKIRSELYHDIILLQLYSVEEKDKYRESLLQSSLMSDSNLNTTNDHAGNGDSKDTNNMLHHPVINASFRDEENRDACGGGSQGGAYSNSPDMCNESTSRHSLFNSDSRRSFMMDKMNDYKHVELIVLLQGLCELMLQLQTDLNTKSNSSSSNSPPVPTNTGANMAPTYTPSSANGANGVNGKRISKHKISTHGSSNKTNKHTPSVSSTDIRQDFRFQIFQYILGLDERWGLELTYATCEQVIKCLEHSQLINQQPNNFFSMRSTSPHSSASPYGGATHPTHGHGTCRFNGHLHLISPSTFNILVRKMPITISHAATDITCTLAYSLATDGSSLRTLYERMIHKPSCSYKGFLIIIQDITGCVFGGFFYGKMENKKSYYGDANSFVFKTTAALKTYPCTNRNSYVMYSDDEKFGMGGGADGYAFLLTDNLLRGSTSMSDTYLNDLLTVSNLFTCANLEVWMI